jgi:hypothetical protein
MGGVGMQGKGVGSIKGLLLLNIVRIKKEKKLKKFAREMGGNSVSLFLFRE